MQGLCCLDVQGEAAMELFGVFVRESRESEATAAEAEQMLAGAFAARGEADELLGGESQHWDIARMALVDRNILRLAVWELLTSRCPKRVVINEALRLAKEFASAESARFINGVVDAAARRIEKDLQTDVGDAADVPEDSSPAGEAIE